MLAVVVNATEMRSQRRKDEKRTTENAVLHFCTILYNLHGRAPLEKWMNHVSITEGMDNVNFRARVPSRFDWLRRRFRQCTTNHSLRQRFFVQISVENLFLDMKLYLLI